MKVLNAVTLALLMAVAAVEGTWAQSGGAPSEAATPEGAASGAAATDPNKKVWSDAFAAAAVGPKEVPLNDQAALKLPQGLLFVPQPHAAKVMEAMGNPGETEIQGLVFPQNDEDWFVVVRYNDAGYVKDEDAKDWNADDMLKSFKEGTAAANEERKKMGISGLEIVGWAEKPSYDAKTHRLVWAMSSKDEAQAASDDLGVNYNTYALGRSGYFSMNLVTDLKALPQYKQRAADVLAALSYKPGRRYEDFDAKTDKVAEYGLAALVLGVGAKKLGFFALAAAFFAKFAKVIFLALAGVAYGAKKWFGRKDKDGSGTEGTQTS